MTTSNNLKHKIFTQDRNGNTLHIEIRLNDECKNGHQDFAITATAWEKGKPLTDRNFIYGGCSHDEILAARPDLAIFVRLHLADAKGVPMYGFYHLREGFNNTPVTHQDFAALFCEHYRITPEQYEAVNKADDKTHFAILLQELGILQQWEAEANEAIKLLESMTGQTFANDSVKSQYTAPTPEQVTEYRLRKKQGYYTEQSAKDRAEKKAAERKAEIIGKIKAEAAKAIEKATHQSEVKLCIFLTGGEVALDNHIYYDHINTVCFNWLSYKKQVDPETIAKCTAALKETHPQIEVKPYKG